MTGIVGVHPAAAPAAASAQLVPAQAVAKFLDAQKVAPAAGRAGIDGVKAAAVRVICVRK